MEALKREKDHNTNVINSILKFTGLITVTYLIALISIYWHGHYLSEKRLVPYSELTTSGLYSAHLALTLLLGVSYFFSLVASLITLPLAFFNKIEKSMKYLLFNVVAHSALFLYFKYSSFLDWAID